MNKLIIIATCLAGVAIAQESAGPIINAVDIDIRGVEFRTALTDQNQDGGCWMVAIATVRSPSIEPHYLRTEYQRTRQFCQNLRDDALLAVKKDMRRVGVLIGDGGTP